LAKANKGKCAKKKKLRTKKCCQTCSRAEYSANAHLVITAPIFCNHCSYRGFVNDAAGEAAVYTHGVCARKDGATTLCTPLRGNPGFPEDCRVSYGNLYTRCIRTNPAPPPPLPAMPPPPSPPSPPHGPPPPSSPSTPPLPPNIPAPPKSPPAQIGANTQAHNLQVAANKVVHAGGR
jgi:hypothetical protein